jgi:hypothetical protein
VGKAISTQEGFDSSFVAYIMAGAFVVAGVLLWMFPMWVAHKLIPRTRFEEKLSLPAREALAVACVILGLWVIVGRAIPSLSWYLALAIYWVGNGQPLSTLEPSRHIEAVTGIVNLIVGCFLIAKFDFVGRLVFQAAPGTDARSEEGK